MKKTLFLCLITVSISILGCASTNPCPVAVWKDGGESLDALDTVFWSGIHAFLSPGYDREVAIAPCGPPGFSCRETSRTIIDIGGKVIKRDRCSIQWELPE